VQRDSIYQGRHRWPRFRAPQLSNRLFGPGSVNQVALDPRRKNKRLTSSLARDELLCAKAVEHFGNRCVDEPFGRPHLIMNLACCRRSQRPQRHEHGVFEVSARQRGLLAHDMIYDTRRYLASRA